MATYEEEEFDFDGSDTNLVKQLRQQVKELSKALKEREEELGEYQYYTREAAVGSILEDFNLNPKIARFIPDDIEASEEAIAEWLDEYGDAFGIVAVDDEPGVDTNSPDVQTAELMSAVETGGIDPSVGQDLQAKITNATSPEELMQILRG